MKKCAFFFTIISLLNATSSLAAQPPNCGKMGEITWIKLPQEIPAACVENRDNNWVAAQDVSVANPEAICTKATHPTSDITDKPIPDRLISNMSSCYCMKNIQLSDGGITPLKCWTFYDRKYE